MADRKFPVCALKNNGYDILEKSDVWSEIRENI